MTDLKRPGTGTFQVHDPVTFLLRLDAAHLHPVDDLPGPVRQSDAQDGLSTPYRPPGRCSGIPDWTGPQKSMSSRANPG